MDEVIKICAKYLILVPVLANIYILWKLKREQRKEMLALIVFGGILAVVLAKIGGNLYSDPRPLFKDHATPLVHSSDFNGFPSDHTLLASFLAFTALLYNRRIGYALIAVGVIVAWGRVAAHVHHLIDIIGSFVISAISVAAVYYLMKYYVGLSKKR